ncbi:MAG: binding-protein-dependent transport system inner rane component [Chloroflexi bacterium]|nr:binding-protein-dependent transport system inner rane component [Chloroflexota bacterium]
MSIHSLQASNVRRILNKGTRIRTINWKPAVGLLLALGPLVLGLVGRLVISQQGLRLGMSLPDQPPSRDHLLGTESTGRDLLAMVVYGTPTSLEIGLIAGGVGTVFGAIFGLVSGYYRGVVDVLFRGAADVMLGIPSLAVLIVISSLMGQTTVEAMALIIANISWPGPARAIRAQVLSLREQSFVSMCKLSGRSGFRIMFQEILPNLLPYVLAGFVGSVYGGIVASVGLQLLGLGQFTMPTLGLIMQTALGEGAIPRGMWWWSPPTVVLVLVFSALFLISIGLDEVANPRLRGTAR